MCAVAYVELSGVSSAPSGVLDIKLRLSSLTASSYSQDLKVAVVILLVALLFKSAIDVFGGTCGRECHILIVPVCLHGMCNFWDLWHSFCLIICQIAC